MQVNGSKIVKRLRGRKHKFLYRLQLIGLALTAIGTQLGALEGFPNRFVIVLLTAGIVMVAVSNFPVDDFKRGYAGDTE